MFRVGQKVVCIYASADSTTEFGLRVGQVYTVSGFGQFMPRGRTLIDLAEIKTDAPHAWCPENFRPVVERKSDISIFTEMLIPSKQKERA